MEKRVMNLSRRQFTKEFKEAAVRRLELGASVAEVARACEVNANVLHRWRRELRDHGAKAFTACRGAAEAAGIGYPRLVY
ncbi:MAG: transposase, partial [Acidobacteriota bacterium]